MLRNPRQNDINYSKRSEEKRFHSDPIFSNNKIGLYFPRDKKEREIVLRGILKEDVLVDSKENPRILVLMKDPENVVSPEMETLTNLE